MKEKSRPREPTLTPRTGKTDPDPLSVEVVSNFETESNNLSADEPFTISVNKPKDPSEGSTIKFGRSGKGKAGLSVIRGKAKKESPKDKAGEGKDDILSMLKEMGIDSDLDGKSEGAQDTQQSRSHLRTHKQMGGMLDHHYVDDGLTVVTEVVSTQQTEYNFGKQRHELNGSRNDYSKTFSNISALHSDLLGRSIDDAVRMNKFRGTSGKSRQKQTSQSRDKFLTQQVDEAGFPQKKRSSEELANSKSDVKVTGFGVPDKKTPLRNSLDRHAPQMPVIESLQVADGIPSLEVENRQSNQQSPGHTPMQFRRLKPKLSIEEKAKPLFDLGALPERPSGPAFVIDVLAKVKSRKKVDRKKHLVKSAFFKLPCGLFYEGSLKFGKLQGKGLLLLQSIDASDRSASETRKFLLYEGSFYNNEVEGNGMLWFRDGSSFEGSFRSGLAHGNGQILGPEGTKIQKGIWINGKYCN